MSTDSPPTSNLQFVDATGSPTAGPREWSRGLLAVNSPPSKLADVRVLRNGEPLRVFVESITGEPRLYAEWPLSGTGQYVLALEVAGSRQELTVTVPSEKLGDAAYATLITDLQTRLPASVAIGLQRTGALAGLTLHSPASTTLQGELVRLRRAVLGTSSYRGLADTLGAIAREPHRMLRKTTAWVERDRVRRLEPLGLVAAILRPDNLGLDNRLPQRVPDARVEHTVDVYENRLLRTYHDQVASRLRRLSAAFAATDALAAVLEVEQLQGLLHHGRQTASFLDHVTALRHSPTTVSMVLLKRPDYRSMLSGYLDFRRSPHVELDETALESPLENLPRLYELWGTLAVIDAVLEVAADAGFLVEHQRLVRHIEQNLLIRVLPDGEPAVVLRSNTTNTVITITPQRTYSSTRGWPRSISFAQRPDVTTELYCPARAELLLFDPKYKLQSEETGGPGDGRPKKIDIDTMHAYRDAIRDETGRRIVSYVAILYPGPSRRFGDNIHAISARPLDRTSLNTHVHEVLEDALDRLASATR